MKGRICNGARIYHGFGSFVWPGCKPPKEEYEGEEYKARTKEPDAIFDVTWDDATKCWICTRVGYGAVGAYGNGAILVRDKDSVLLVDEDSVEVERRLGENQAEKDKEENHRYKVVKGSDSGHCCFAATVIDTTIERGDKRNICESFSMENAELIAKALNALEVEARDHDPDVVSPVQISETTQSVSLQNAQRYMAIRKKISTVELQSILKREVDNEGDEAYECEIDSIVDSFMEKGTKNV